ncbi:hypothetical protein MRY87_10475 [bacterium]|nr:hypothetical protein [bacterium]
MALDEKDLDALRLLFRDEVDVLRDEMKERFDMISGQLEGLYQNDERREQEYLFSNEQVSRLEKKVDALEKKCA